MKDHDDLIAEWIVAWEDSVEQGNPIEPDELCREHPELIPELRQAIDKLGRMRWLTDSTAPEPMGSDQQTIALGSVLANRYQVKELLGVGGFGSVYRGFDEKLQREVAIKVGRPDRYQSAESIVEEARKAAKLRHPNLVTIHDVVADDSNAFIISDLINGPTLSRLIPVSMERAIDIIAQVADAVDFVHRSGIIHCDIKPDNVLLCPDGSPVLADFGIARVTQDSSHKPLGTAAYMAPELLAHGESSPTEQSDVWSLGVVLYQLLYGKLPSRKDSTTTAQKSTDRPLIPKQLSEIVSRCLEPDPSKRTQSARELADQLRAFAHKSTSRAESRNLTQWSSVALPIILLIGAYAFWINRSAKPTTDSQQQASVEGMYFDGETKIVTPLVQFAPCTIEAWVRPSTNDATSAFIGSDSAGEYGLGLGVHQGRLYVELLSYSSHPVVLIRSDRWTHIAACYDAHETRLYVDGRLVSREMPTMMFGETAFAIGALSPVDTRFQMQGHIRSVRISKGVRYQGDFTPTEDLLADGDSQLTYDLKQLDGEKIRDLSGNENHGSIVRVKPFSPEAKQKPYTFTFRGGTAITTPVERFAPSTLEAWVIPFAQGIHAALSLEVMYVLSTGLD